MQVKYGATPSRAFGNDAPALVTLDAAFGENAAVQWLMPQLYAVGEFAGVRDKMNEMQTLELARTIRAHYGFLTVTEMLLFFSNLKAGRYGKFYGSVDPMVITEALCGPFMAERERHIERIESAQREQEREQRREGVMTFEQFMRLKQQQ